MEPPDDRSGLVFEVVEARGRTAKRAAGTAFLVALGVLMLLIGTGALPWNVRLPSAVLLGVGTLCVLWFGWHLSFLLGRLRSPRPSLVLDAEGLVDATTALGVGRVRWDEIGEVRVVEGKPQAHVAVHLRDPRAVRARQGGWTRWLQRLNGRTEGTPVLIPAGSVPLPLADLAAKIEDFRARFSPGPPR